MAKVLVSSLLDTTFFSSTKKTVLITGIAGLLGSHLSRYLLDKGYFIIGIDNFSGGYQDYIDERVVIENFDTSTSVCLNLDLLDSAKLESIFETCKPDYVYHLAAYAAEGLSPFIRNFNYTNNVLCSINIINNCIKFNVKKLIFTSSMAVYGNNQTPFNELQQPAPADPYGIAKYTIEMDLKLAHEQFGLNYSIVRPHNIVGIYQNIWDKYRNVIGIWCRQILEGEPLSIYGDGLQERAFSDVRFCLEPLEKLLTIGNGEIFNIGADKHYKIIDIAKLLMDYVKTKGYFSDIIHYETRHEVKIAYSDHTKAKNLLDFKDETDIQKLLKDIFDWAETQPKREQKTMEYEIEKGLYSFWKK